jgi:hypothetical protein
VRLLLLTATHRPILTAARQSAQATAIKIVGQLEKLIPEEFISHSQRVALHEQPCNGSKRYARRPDCTNDAPRSLIRNLRPYQPGSKAGAAILSAAEVRNLYGCLYSSEGCSGVNITKAIYHLSSRATISSISQTFLDMLASTAGVHLTDYSGLPLPASLPQNLHAHQPRRKPSSRGARRPPRYGLGTVRRQRSFDARDEFADSQVREAAA